MGLGHWEALVKEGKGIGSKGETGLFLSSLSALVGVSSTWHVSFVVIDNLWSLWVPRFSVLMAGDGRGIGFW